MSLRCSAGLSRIYEDNHMGEAIDKGSSESVPRERKTSSLGWWAASASISIIAMVCIAMFISRYIPPLQQHTPDQPTPPLTLPQVQSKNSILLAFVVPAETKIATPWDEWLKTAGVNWYQPPTREQIMSLYYQQKWEKVLHLGSSQFTWIHLENHQSGTDTVYEMEVDKQFQSMLEADGWKRVDTLTWSSSADYTFTPWQLWNRNIGPEWFQDPTEEDIVIGYYNDQWQSHDGNVGPFRLIRFSRSLQGGVAVFEIRVEERFRKMLEADGWKLSK